jgi:drug/metabolite transporter (DMT)-like permease
MATNRALFLGKARQVLAYTLLCLIWGSTWLVIKVGYGDLGPFNVAAVRFLLAGLLFVLLVPILGARWPQGRGEWLLVLWVGAILFAADYGLIYWAEQRLDSGLTAIIFAVLPVMTSVAAHFYLDTERLTTQKLLGTVIAFSGVVTLFADHTTIDTSQNRSMAAVLVAALCATTTMLATKRYGSKLHPAALNAPAMLIGAVILFIVAWVSGEDLRLPSGGAVGAVLYLALAGSVVAFLIFFWLLKTWTATTMSLINVVTPLVAIVLGFLFRAERPTAWTGVGGTLILAGVLLTTVRKSQRS